MPSPFDLLESGKEEALGSLNYKVKPRSVVVLLKSAWVSEPSRATNRPPTSMLRR